MSTRRLRPARYSGFGWKLSNYLRQPSIFSSSWSGFSSVNMSSLSFVASCGGKEVPVTTEQSVSDALANQSSKLTSFRPFSKWLSKMGTSTQFQLQSIHVQSVDVFSSGSIGFVKMTTKVVKRTGQGAKPVPGIVLLRGGSVAMFVVLQAEEDASEKYVVLVAQPRVPCADMALLELPAGMIDDGTFSGAAARELEEECGITVSEEELEDLTPSGGPVLTSPGILDEEMRFYRVTKKMPRQQIHDMQGRLGGLENEHINVVIVPYQQCATHPQVRDGKVFIALGLDAVKSIEAN
uniref:ARAD1D19866p n=1 Tax=Blastobotrys adeninivorans TaxID=409370 RepID=A0A060TAI9_BLAAD